MLHSLTFLSRVLPPDILDPAASWFEARVCEVCARLLGLTRGSSFSPSVRRQLALPIRSGGFGIRSAVSLSPLAFYASLSSALSFISGLGIADSGPAISSPTLSDVHSISSSHSDVSGRQDGGALVGGPHFPLLASLVPFLSSPFLSRLSLPSSVPLFWSSFSRSSPPPRLQHLLTEQLDSSLFSDHSFDVSACPAAARAFASASQPSSGSWLSCLPSPSFLSLSLMSLL